MKQFVVTLDLLAGPPGPEVGEAQQAFLAELFEQGTLVMSGPFSDGHGGMAILRGDSLEAAQDLYGESPIVRSGVAAVDVREWNVLLDSTRR
ncbi:YciI family protein [Streptomyces canus]|uniref:YciI family protein n=1 Tax=Streptomyces canus TaxID=58343 RepID=UPI0033D6273F